MITTITAATDIIASINTDLANRPNFTMTHSQLRHRIEQYFEGMNDDLADATYAMLTLPGIIRCFRD